MSSALARPVNFYRGLRLPAIFAAPRFARFPVLLVAAILPRLTAAPEVTTAELEPETARAAGGLVRSLVARQPLLKNPVSVSVDVDGRIYATETTRRKAADLDIRNFREWIPRDLALTSVEEKRAFFRSELVPENRQYAGRVKDQNGDGQVDWRDLTVLSEKIHLLEDTDGDGLADTSTVFAEGFNTEVTGIAAGVLARRGDVYATIAPDLWKLRDTDGDGVADRRESLAHGFGIHVAYAGHDMHGLTFGPDGRIYWTIGDKGSHVVSQEGERWFHPHEGALLRCYPDGSGFEVYARGLRNLQEFAFDDYGNIFGIDNDADFGGEKERFVYVAEGSDSGWRSYYQYRGKQYNPWLAEHLAVPYRKDQPAYVTPPMGLSLDGPAGFAFNPGTALNERYRDAFFLTQFPAGKISAFTVEQNGAGFRMSEPDTVMSGVATVGASFGPDGALYFTDWQGGYALNDKGAIWKLDDPEEAGGPLRREVARLLRDGPGDADNRELAARLGHADQRVRLDAQWELARRGAVAVLETIAADFSAPRLARTHAIWAISQTRERLADLMAALAADDDPEIRAQTARWAGEAGCGDPNTLVALIRDPSPRVAHLAAIAAGKLGLDEAVPAAVELLEHAPDDDTTLRHSAISALAGGAGAARRAGRAAHDSPDVRRGAVVALRRQGAAEVTAFLGDPDPRVLTEAVAAIYDDRMIEPALPGAAAVLTRSGTLAEAAARRSMAANRRLGDADSARRLAEFAASPERPEPLRRFAVELLASWDETVPLDPADGRGLPLSPGDRPGAIAAARQLLAGLDDDSPRSLAEAANQMARKLGIGLDAPALAAEIRDPSVTPASRAAALAALADLGGECFVETAGEALESPEPALRAAAAAALAPTRPAAVMTYLTETGLSSDDPAEARAALDTLAALDHPDAREKTAALLGALAAGEAPASLGLDILDAARSVAARDPEIERRVREFTARQARAEPLGEFNLALEGGDAARGAEIFTTHLGARCTLCHRVGEDGSAVGPPLTEAGESERVYLLESLIDPQAEITPGYGFTTVTLEDGQTLTGTLVGETDDALQLATADGETRRIPAADVADRTDPISTMPPMGAILTKAELRDLVAYLATLK
jgi:putative membrane-bound dehydrogenase-like protein